MNLERLKNHLARDEGEKLKPYKCTANKLTIGIGRNLEDRGITKEESQYLFNNDVDTVVRELSPALKHHYNLDFEKLSEVRQEVLLNMAFQMGVPRLLRFKYTFNYIKDNDFKSASIEMLNSLWAKQIHEADMKDGVDSINRAERLSYAMLNDKFIEDRLC